MRSLQGIRQPRPTQALSHSANGVRVHPELRAKFDVRLIRLSPNVSDRLFRETRLVHLLATLRAAMGDHIGGVAGTILPSQMAAVNASLMAVAAHVSCFGFCERGWPVPRSTNYAMRKRELSANEQFAIALICF
jgi:hypothetical protein